MQGDQNDRRQVYGWIEIPSDTPRVWLDELTPNMVRVGYGELGKHGVLGYECRSLVIKGVKRTRSLSAHPPSQLRFELDGRFSHFCCEVALNDGVPSAADFLVMADGQLRGIARNVRAGHQPRLLTVDVRGVMELELIIRHHCWTCCHAAWIDPFLVTFDQPIRTFLDPLHRTEIQIPNSLPDADLCIVTAGSAGFEEWIDDLFGSVCANAQCPNALLAIVSFDHSEELRRVAEKYNAVTIPCRSIVPLSVASKSALYSIGRVIRARNFLCLDADTVVLEDLRPVVHALDALPAGTILACRDLYWTENLGNAVSCIYNGKHEDVERLIGANARSEAAYPLVINDGFFAGSSAALSALDDTIRGFQSRLEWLGENNGSYPWRNQFLFNLALAHSDCGVALDPRFNVQLHAQPAAFSMSKSGISAVSFGCPASIVHFNGAGRNLHPEWRGRYRSIRNPLVRSDGGNGAYQSFLVALRKWLGLLGPDALAWSFYGMPDGVNVHPCDASEFPLLATLHYLIHSNGCRRVLETGTARGVSAACLASAVAHMPNSRVVTIDLNVWPERESLWNCLPLAFRQCIVPRQNDAVSGLQEALKQGEVYDAVLLDTVHTAEHVLQEFEHASQIVCTGGLILIHDAVFPYGTVAAALEQIDRKGFGVTRLWVAEGGGKEDGGLGLAVIENTCRSR